VIQIHVNVYGKGIFKCYLHLHLPLSFIIYLCPKFKRKHLSLGILGDWFQHTPTDTKIQKCLSSLYKMARSYVSILYTLNLLYITYCLRLFTCVTNFLKGENNRKGGKIYFGLLFKVLAHGHLTPLLLGPWWRGRASLGGIVAHLVADRRQRIDRKGPSLLTYFL
jgi:hypothetical protein